MTKRAKQKPEPEIELRDDPEAASVGGLFRSSPGPAIRSR
jgi:hypothetical protein